MEDMRGRTMLWRLWRAATGIACLALLVAACGGGSPTATPLPSTPTPMPVMPDETQAVPTPEPSVAPTPPPPSLPPLTIALADMPGFQLIPSDAAARPYLDVVYDRVIGTDEHGNMDARTGWADSWTANKDATAWTLKSKKKIVFHDGVRATSRDVKFGVERMLADDFLGPGGADIRRDVDSVRAPDESTVIVRLRGPGILFPVAQLSGMGGSGPLHLLPGQYIESRGEDDARWNPIGSGPYQFVRSGDGELVLQAVPRHWRFGAPRVEGLIFRLESEAPIRLALLKAGRIDMTPIGRAHVDYLRQSGMNIFSRGLDGVGAYRLEEQYKQSYEDYGANPLADVRVRRALDWYAIDRQAIVAGFMKGLAVPTMSYPATSIDPAYAPLAIPEYNPTRARDLLKEAGYPNGFEMDFYIVPRPNLPEGTAVAEAMASSWEAIGVKVNRIRTDYGSYRYILLGRGFSKPTAFGVWLLAALPAAGLEGATFHKISNRFAASLDPELDRLATAWAVSGSMDEYVANGRAYMQRYYDLALTTALFTSGEVWATDSRVARWSMGVDPGSYRIDVLAATLPEPTPPLPLTVPRRPIS